MASNSETTDATSAILASRSYLYTLFQSVFGTEPTEEQLGLVCSDETKSAVQLFDVDENSPYHAAVSTALRELDAVAQDVPGHLSDLKDTYTRLFLGPMEFKAPAWESQYVTNEPVLFQKNTLEVRNFYRTQGFLPTEYPKVSDDHIALECGFMAKLAQRASAGDQSALEPSAQFLDEHLLKYIDEYAEKVEGSEEGFYPAIARLAAAFMHLDRSVIDELKA